jgi:hypothetical protein
MVSWLASITSAFPLSTQDPASNPPPSEQPLVEMTQRVDPKNSPQSPPQNPPQVPPQMPAIPHPITSAFPFSMRDPASNPPPSEQPLVEMTQPVDSEPPPQAPLEMPAAPHHQSDSDNSEFPAESPAESTAGSTVANQSAAASRKRKRTKASRIVPIQTSLIVAMLRNN